MSEQDGLHRGPKQPFAVLLLIALLTALSIPANAAPKTDIIIFKNGDKLTGEFKMLQRGRLSLNTDATGTISIEWDKIAYIISNQNVQVETNSGARYFGHLGQTEKSGRVVVETEDGIQMLDSARVIIMSPIEDEGLSALDVDLTIGYNFAKAGGVTQGTVGIDASYRTQKRIFGISASSTVNDSDTQAASERKNFAVDYKRLWQKRWYVYGDLTFDQNDELDLDLRTSLGGGMGRFVIQSNSMLLELAAGLQVSNESVDNEPEDIQSIEGKLTFNWDWFRFDDPELDWSTQFVLFPNLSELGRLRANFDTSLQWEMINDLKWGIAIYSTYDNKPQGVDSSTTDYGINTTLTYEF
jgi:putative salt-induced outer membrane protein YdiY